MPATSGRVPIRLLAADTATSLVWSEISSASCGELQVALGQLHVGEAHPGPGPDRRLHPRPDVRVMVEPGDHDLVAGAPARRERAGQPVGQGGHVRAEDDALGLAAGEVRHGLPALGGDRVGAAAGRERASGVSQADPVRAGDRVDHRPAAACPPPRPGRHSRRPGPGRRRAPGRHQKPSRHLTPARNIEVTAPSRAISLRIMPTNPSSSLPHAQTEPEPGRPEAASRTRAEQTPLAALCRTWEYLRPTSGRWY